LALQGADAIDPWLHQVLQDTDVQNALRHECVRQLQSLHDATWQQLTERSSEFQLLLPEDSEDAVLRTEALAQWCEGYLHGLVIRADGDELKARLAAEPLSDIIRDMLEITRAEADPDADDETNEVAYAELLEYLRVAAQLVYEELAEFRRPRNLLSDAGSQGLVH
jgi:yecA family protein